ncbi:MAG TPA: TIGR03435 family protein [Bryobacteraceae bacterium]|jgi:uncharacterized protein (TIGR03435 family)|nr:TIGR03435 family protein [Bryobacteraceae bacterium]
MLRTLSVLLGLCFCGVAFGQTDQKALRVEVASVKLSPPDGKRSGVVGCKGGPGTTDPGLFACTNTSLASLLVFAFHVNQYQILAVDNLTAYDLSAKVPAGTTREQFALMLQNLLVERFQLSYHFEKKKGPVFDLVVARSGLQMQESPPAGAGDESTGSKAIAPGGIALDSAGFPKVAAPQRGTVSMSAQGGLFRLVCRDASIQFLAGMLAAQIGAPVTDSTGLKANYDFTLFWIAPQLQGVVDGPTPSQAIEEQLGLRLVRRRGWVDLFVIDHVAGTPVEN